MTFQHWPLLGEEQAALHQGLQGSASLIRVVLVARRRGCAAAPDVQLPAVVASGVPKALLGGGLSCQCNECKGVQQAPRHASTAKQKSPVTVLQLDEVGVWSLHIACSYKIAVASSKQEGQTSGVLPLSKACKDRAKCGGRLELGRRVLCPQLNKRRKWR